MPRPDRYDSADGLKHGEGFRSCKCGKDPTMVVHSNKHRVTLNKDTPKETRIVVMDETFWCDSCFEDEFKKKFSDRDGFTAIEYTRYLEMATRRERMGIE